MPSFRTPLPVIGAIFGLATLANSSGASAEVYIVRPRPAIVVPPPAVAVAPACVTRTVRVWVGDRYVNRSVRTCT
jgi:hypothetical protein